MAPKPQRKLPNDSARNVAVNALLAFDQHQHYIQKSLESILAKNKLDQRDRSFATELAIGTCRRLITLDHIIAYHTTRPTRRIAPAILQILRLGLYQLIYLTGTPEFALVDQAVRQAATVSGNRAGGFVNALLRSVQRDISARGSTTDTPPASTTLCLDEHHACRLKTAIFPDPDSDPPAYWAATLAHPLWLVQRWLKQHDLQTVIAICHTNNARPPLTLRPNTLRCTPDELLACLAQHDFGATSSGPVLQLTAPADPKKLPRFDQGLFTVQDATAAAVAPILDPSPGDHVLDLCAAPGGKTTHLAELTSDSARIIACDVSDQKLDLIRQNCRRLGIKSVQPCLAKSLGDIIGRSGPFDAVLVDAPCSNTGVMARRPEVRHLLTPHAIDALAARQMKLLQQAANALKPTGKLLYSTCSIDPAENEQLVQRFLANHPNFSLSHQKLTLPRSGSSWHDGGYTALLQRRA